MISVMGELGLPEHVVNVEGTAIARRHRISAIDAIFTTRHLRSMRFYGIKRGVGTLCIGGGQGYRLGFGSDDLTDIRRR